MRWMERMVETRIVCHRGALLNAPENTFASANTALELGGSIIELDIRQSADGVLYVMHDERVDRTTNGTGKISELTSAEIDLLDAGGWFDEQFKDEPVPRLQDYLSSLLGRAGFYLEIKKADCKAVAELVRELGNADQCFTFSFDPEMREQMRLYAPEIKHMIQWTTAGSIESAINEYHAQIIEFNEHDFAEKDILDCKEAGLKVMFFTDRPDVEHLTKALKLEMDFVNIDHIEVFDRLRRNFKR